MSPPTDGPRLHLAPGSRRTLSEVDAASKAADDRIVQIGSVAGTAVARVTALAADVDAEADETLAEARAIRRGQRRHSTILLGLSRGHRRLEKSLDHLTAEMRSIGGSIADLEAYLVVRDARTARKTAITTSSLTASVVVVVSIVLKLIFGV